MFSDRRGITPVIATLLLIAITVAAVAGFYIFYNAFIKQSKVSSDAPSVTISGPSTANPGDTIVISVKNSGNVDVSSWIFGTPVGLSGLPAAGADQGELKVGSQKAFSAQVTTTVMDAWTVQVYAYTQGGSEASDVLIVESA